MSANDSTEASTAPATPFSSTVDLEVDPSSLSLGGSSPRPLRHIDETSPRMVMNQFGRWRVSVDVITLTHGTFGVRAEPATLVVLRVRLNGDSQGATRLRTAKIKLKVRPAAADGSARGPGEQTTDPESVQNNNNTDLTSEAVSTNAVPTVKLWAPERKIFDVETVSSEVTQGVNAGLSLASIIGSVFNLSMQRSVTQVVEREVGSEIRGTPETSDAAQSAGLDIDDTVTWNVLETPTAKAGVPLELRLGAVIAGGRRDGPMFHATLTARVETGWGMKLFGKPWSKPQPLVIRDDVSFVDQSAADLELRGRNYETLKADEWSVLLGS
ncbi:hypothetical protein CEP52_003393 [Fusarium oligoseptatum]|uniref:Uncharacterized protein n=1 Tax=Fusarium oligoseptatum TaxID=2604345 RepID=A0A428U8Z2_9HYPO|nr:hypothetical protein CEP52_003393 [Fusarium oligoseptatum]